MDAGNHYHRLVFDIVLAAATIVDGQGGPRFVGSVGVRNGRITAITRDQTPEPSAAEEWIDGSGLVLAPGFIDVHTHSDLGPLVDPTMPSTVRQGVTTVVVGNCGASPWPVAGAIDCAHMVGGDDELAHDLDSFADYLARLDAAGPSVNLAALVGHGAIRGQVMQSERRPPTVEELRAMRRLAAEAMDEGAIGLSTGLIYVPGSYATTDEVAAIAEEAARRGGIYASHIRGEGSNLFSAVDEAIEIGRRAELPAHVSHLKCESARAWGRADELLALFHDGQDLSADQYPYTAWASSLASFLPDWAPVDQLADRLADPYEHERLVSAVEHGEPGFQSSIEGVGWERIVIESSGDGRGDGRDIGAIALGRQIEPIDAFFQLLIEDPDTTCIGHAMDAQDVRAIMGDPDVMVASDGVSMSPDGPLGTMPVHPRNYGTFPRVVGAGVREGVLTLESAVRKMTSLPADRFGLLDRGRIVDGAWADLVLFDADTVEDRATFAFPHSYPTGVHVVIVNGIVSWSGYGRPPSPGRGGRILRHGATS